MMKEARGVGTENRVMGEETIPMEEERGDDDEGQGFSTTI